MIAGTALAVALALGSSPRRSPAAGATAGKVQDRDLSGHRGRRPQLESWDPTGAARPRAFDGVSSIATVIAGGSDAPSAWPGSEPTWCGPRRRFRYGDYAALRRPYLPADFRADAKGHNVVATVHMEAEWDTADEVGETRWLATLRAEHGLPTVAIGHARLEDPGVDEVLAGHARFDFIRGIRQKPTAAATPVGGSARRRGLDGRSALAARLRAARAPRALV